MRKLNSTPNGDFEKVATEYVNPTFQSGAPHRLFDALASFLVEAAADGKRFLVNLPQQDSGPQAITVVLNWQAGLKK